MKTAALALTALFAAGIASAHAQTSPPPAPTGTSTTLSKADRSFAEKAAQAGAGEVAEAQLAQSKSQRQDVKDFAQRMVTDHTKAGDQLKQIAGQEGLTLPDGPSAADQRQASKLSAASGSSFDKSYIQDQRAAHKQAVALFTKESKSGKDPALKQFAAQTLPTLQDHYKMITAMPLKAAATH